MRNKYTLAVSHLIKDIEIISDDRMTAAELKESGFMRKQIQALCYFLYVCIPFELADAFWLALELDPDEINRKIRAVYKQNENQNR